MREVRKLPVGIENFEDIRTEGFYYVDKTGFIRDLLNGWSKVTLFTRPRRFGKTLNMSMLRYFFEYGTDPALFQGLEIWKEQDLCERYLGKYPVIFLSLKDVNGSSFDTARAMLCSEIGNEALRFSFLKNSGALEEQEKKLYAALTHVTDEGSFDFTDQALTDSLFLLTKLLCKHYGRKVILLIDEYDVPLDKAHQEGYYDPMVHLIRNLFSKVLKGNSYLQFAVMTGCLRISRESIFTGLNNLRVLTVASAGFEAAFGFTDDEVREMLGYYGLTSFYQSVREWYDGYLFGETHVYCPWDVVSYCDELRRYLFGKPGGYLKPENYWANSSSNDIIRTLLKGAGTQTKTELERLIAGESIVKKIEENLVYQDLYQNTENIWSVLFSTGYLTCAGVTDSGMYRLKIPNLEIRSIFVEQIMTWFQEYAKEDSSKLDRFCSAVENGDAGQVESCFTEYLKKTISIRDTFVAKPKKENFYHGILLGLLAHREDWYIRSNAESGEGYSDIQIFDEDTEKGIIIEVKYAEKADFDGACAQALKQIRDMDYEERMRKEGITQTIRYGIACYKKKCRVKCETG